MGLNSKRDSGEYLGISESMVAKLVKEGKLPFVKIGDRVLFRQEDLNTFIKKNRIPAGGKK